MNETGLNSPIWNMVFSQNQSNMGMNNINAVNMNQGMINPMGMQNTMGMNNMNMNQGMMNPMGMQNIMGMNYMNMNQGMMNPPMMGMGMGMMNVPMNTMMNMNQASQANAMFNGPMLDSMGMDSMNINIMDNNMLNNQLLEPNIPMIYYYDPINKKKNLLILCSKKR